MNNLKEGFKKIWDKFKGFSKGIQIAIIVAIVSVIIAMASLAFYSTANKYQLLFSGLDPYDAQTILNKLTEKKVDTQIKGDAILVPKNMVDSLRLELAPELSNGSQGYELMDSGSSFGMTDEEFKLKKLRMQQGELEKTIKSFPQVDDARVHITAAKDSVFVTDKEPGKAAVYLKVAAGNKLSKEQVKSIVALVSGSTDNIPKENIEVIDDKMNLLSEGLNDEDSVYLGSEAIQMQYNLEKQYEETLQNTVEKLLIPVIGKDKVNVAINADLDFDSKKKTETIVDPQKVIVSQQSIKEQNSDGSAGTSGGPVDENMGNTIDDGTGNTTSSREEQTTNYEVGKTENTVISAPGEVRTLTASVIVDANLTPALQQAIENAVSTAIGLKQERGDKVSVVGITFDPTAAGDNGAVTDPFADNSNKKLYTYIALAIAALAGIIITIIVLVRRRRSKEDDEEQPESLLDVVIDDKIAKMPEEVLNPINFEEMNAQVHLEGEVKKYASEKPEQVVDIIKSWLAESER